MSSINLRFYLFFLWTMKLNKKVVFALLVLASLFTIFFIGREFDKTTGKRHMIITSNGLSYFRKWLDVSWGTRLIYRISYDKYEKVYQGTELTAIKKLIEDIILKNIDGRISKLGVSDYKAYVQNLDDQQQIVVEIWWIADLNQAKEIIGKTVELEFKLKNPNKLTIQSIAERKTIAQNLMAEIAKTPELMKKITDGKMSEDIYYNAFSGATIDQLPELYKNNKSTLDKMEMGKLYGKLLEGTYATISNQNTLWTTSQTVKLDGFTMTRLIDKSEGKDTSGNVAILYTLEDVFVQNQENRISATDKNNNILNGAYFKFANTSTSQMGEPVVAINLDDKGKEIFCSISEANIGKPMAIFVGGELLTAPNIQSKICWGSAQIDGSFTIESAKELSDALNDGALPAPLILMQEEKISPTLGDNAFTWALWAMFAGFIAIAVLIFFMYDLKRMILTCMVLGSFLILLFGLIKLSDYALSLSGIAAIILAIGMAVDANILMYERFNEEIKDGKSIWWAIDYARDRSWRAIRDSQISTGLIALLLFTMGINIFKGFGAMMLTCLALVLLFNVPLTKMLMIAFYIKKQD